MFSVGSKVLLDGVGRVFTVVEIYNEGEPFEVVKIDDGLSNVRVFSDRLTLIGDGSGEALPEFDGNIEREFKPTNPKDAIGCDKLPLHLWPTTATAMGCLGMLEGMLKYGRDNFRESGVRNTIYIAACLRHIHSYLEGEDHATDSGTPHLANALSCLGIIVDAQAAGKLIDDRKYNGSGYRKLVDNLTPHVRRLKDLFADKNPKHYTIEDNQ